MNRSRMAWVGLAVLIGSAGLVGVSAESAAAWSDGACQDDKGVTVVVDYQELGGGVFTRCADVQAGATGLDALKAAGVNVDGTARYGQAFVCRLGGKPSADQDLPIVGNEGYREQCVDTPPGQAFWSYWHASNGGSWTFSNKGGTARTVTIGGYEGWSFSLNATSSSNPAPRVAPSHPVKTTPPAVAPGTGGQAGAGQGTAGGNAGQAGGSAGSQGASGSNASSSQAAGSNGSSGADGQGAGAGGQSSNGKAGASSDPAVSGGAATNADGSPQSPDAAVADGTPDSSASSPQDSALEAAAGTVSTDRPTENVLGAPASSGGGIPVGTVVSLGLIALVGGAGGATWWLRSRGAR